VAGAVEARESIPVARAELFARLSRLENHWALADRWVEVVSLNGDATGGVVRLNGPFGLGRTARTTVDRVEEPELIEGTAEVGPHTSGKVSWRFEEAGAGTLVTLRAELVGGSPADRLIWAAGGRIWLEGRLRGTLARLRSDYES
jgi:hypothetical protein